MTATTHLRLVQPGTEGVLEPRIPAAAPPAAPPAPVLEPAPAVLPDAPVVADYGTVGQAVATAALIGAGPVVAFVSWVVTGEPVGMVAGGVLGFVGALVVDATGRRHV